jgi:hypothetical protein
MFVVLRSHSPLPPPPLPPALHPPPLLKVSVGGGGLWCFHICPGAGETEEEVFAISPLSTSRRLPDGDTWVQQLLNTTRLTRATTNDDDMEPL